MTKEEMIEVTIIFYEMTGKPEQHHYWPVDWYCHARSFMEEMVHNNGYVEAAILHKPETKYFCASLTEMRWQYTSEDSHHVHEFSIDDDVSLQSELLIDNSMEDKSLLELITMFKDMVNEEEPTFQDALEALCSDEFWAEE